VRVPPVSWYIIQTIFDLCPLILKRVTGYRIHSVTYAGFQFLDIAFVLVDRRCLAVESTEERRLPGFLGHRPSPHWIVYCGVMWTIDRADECTKILRNIRNSLLVDSPTSQNTRTLLWETRVSQKYRLWKNVSSGIQCVYLFISYAVSWNTQNELSVVFITQYVCFRKLLVTWLWIAKEK
jgi:hypothetical protein